MILSEQKHRQRRPTYAQGVAFAEYVQRLADVGKVSQSYATNVWDWAHNRKDVTEALAEIRPAKVTRIASLQCHCDHCRPIPFGRFNPTVFVCGRCGGNATGRKESE